MTGKSVRRVYRLIDLISSSANDYIKCVFAVAVVLTWSIFPTRPLNSGPLVGLTLNMGEIAGTGGTLAYVIARDAPSSSSGHGVAHSGRKVSLY